MQKGIDYPGIAIIFHCHDGKGNYLFARRSENCRDEHGRWDVGGGALDINHTVLDTLAKEIKEEYCADIISHEFLAYDDVHRTHNGEKTHWIALHFKVLVDRTKVKIGEPHKFDKLGWFTMDNLPSPLHSALPDFLKRYKAKFS